MLNLCRSIILAQKILNSLSLVTDIAPIPVSYRRMKWIAKEDSEILRVAATHPVIDILKLLAQSDHDPYRLCKELGITYKSCYIHLKMLEKGGLMGGRFKYHITDRGRKIL